MAKPTPESLAKSNTEHGHQSALFCAIAPLIRQYPCLRWLHAIPNGGDRDRVTASNLKAEGVKAGVHDVCLPVARGGYFGLYLEMKKPGRETEKNGGMSDDQVAFQSHLRSEGYATFTCYDWQAAFRIVVGYVSLPRTESTTPPIV